MYRRSERSPGFVFVASTRRGRARWIPGQTEEAVWCRTKTATRNGETAHVAYILRVDAGDPSGESFNDGDYALYISVTDEDIAPHENANPVRTLRIRYDAWKAQEGLR